jgi:1-deoxy-D-xylulose-5-phosphate reductoisomerase
LRYDRIATLNADVLARLAVPETAAASVEGLLALDQEARALARQCLAELSA